MKPKEIKPLVMAARKAFDCQQQAGLLDVGDTFDSWRHSQCMSAVGKPGITACNHADFRPLLAHFQILAGDDAAAFSSLITSGKPTDHAIPGDTHEARRVIAYQIAQAIASQSTITVGYIVFLVRQKNRRPDLTLGSDWQSGLADRCTTNQLSQILYTIINRIASHNGTGSTEQRNKSQRSDPRS